VLKTLAENLWAVHSNLFDYAAARPEASATAAKRYDEVFTATVYDVCSLGEAGVRLDRRERQSVTHSGHLDGQSRDALNRSAAKCTARH
jgi:hypothetical protein